MTQETQPDPQKQAPDWPVESVKDLTVRHVREKQKLVDEIERPLRAKITALAQAYADALDSHNDRLRTLEQATKQGNKDAQRLNQRVEHSPLLQEAFQDAGLVEEQ